MLQCQEWLGEAKGNTTEEIKRYYKYYLFAISVQTVLTEKKSLIIRCNLTFIVKENFCPKSSQSEEVKKTGEEESNTRWDIQLPP